MIMNLMKIFNSLIATILFSLVSSQAFAVEFSISAESNFISMLRPGQKITAGYMNIIPSEDATIIKIEAKMIGRIEAHSMIMDGEIMKMRKILPELLKNKKYQFKSGGDHLMLFDVERDLKKGDDVDFLFTFQLKNKKVISKSIQFKVN